MFVSFSVVGSSVLPVSEESWLWASSLPELDDDDPGNKRLSVKPRAHTRRPLTCLTKHLLLDSAKLKTPRAVPERATSTSAATMAALLPRCFPL